MVRLDRIYTGGGDTGQTSLGDGSRVAKHDARVDAYGDVDEANAVIGMARLAAGPDTDALLQQVQNDLFDLGADLCVPEQGRKGEGALRITQAQCDRLESEIDRLNDGLQPLSSFILPGGTPCAAHLHLARTVTRRAERKVTLLSETQTVSPQVIVYLNRLSDWLFVLARHENNQGKNDVLWIPGQSR